MAFSFFLTVFSSDAALSEMIDDLADRVSVCGQMSQAEFENRTRLAWK